MIAAAVVGRLAGRRRRVAAGRAGATSRLGMGVALLVAAALLARHGQPPHWLPGGGGALGLHHGALVLAIPVVAASFGLGVLMNLGIGNFAPTLDPGQPAGHQPPQRRSRSDGLGGPLLMVTSQHEPGPRPAALELSGSCSA